MSNMSHVEKQGSIHTLQSISSVIAYTKTHTLANTHKLTLSLTPSHSLSHSLTLKKQKKLTHPN